MEANTFDKLLVALHRLLPARLLGRLIYRLSRSERVWLKNALIQGFTALYSVDLSEAELGEAKAYASFNAFFTRRLKSGARQITADPTLLLCPADGFIAQTGRATDGQLLQAKGMSFSAQQLLGDDALAAQLANAPFATVYLAPHNYHRVHMPAAGVLVQTRFIPGKLYSVNARTAAVIPDLYAINERLVCEFRSPTGPFAMVLVGAINVASMTTAWEGEIFPTADGSVIHRRFDDGSVRFEQGDYMGHFNMGSTVVLIGPPGECTWDNRLTPGKTVWVGEPLGKLA